MQNKQHTAPSKSQGSKPQTSTTSQPETNKKHPQQRDEDSRNPNQKPTGNRSVESVETEE